MNNVLHVLDHSLPEHDGYSFRSHSILTQLKQTGQNIRVITGPKQSPVHSAEATIDGIRYTRTPIDEGVGTSGALGQLRTIRLTSAGIAGHLKRHATDIIHVHSPCLNGLAALGQGRPVVYEMRSSWEDASISVGTTQEGSARYRLSKMLETYVTRRADAVVVICDGLKAELIKRGIPDDKITVVPNALTHDMFVTPDSNKVAELKERYALNGCHVVGFFGSFFEWEGVDSLIKATPAVLESVANVRILIAGGGRQEEALHDLVTELGLEKNIVFAGRVDHDEIGACYALADVMAYPRIPDRLTNMVTPLKPLEAMAHGTAVVASDVGGHRELVVDGDTGILFEAGNHEDLAQKLVAALSRPDEVRGITIRAFDYVRRERLWSQVVERYLPVYAKLVARQKV